MMEYEVQKDMDETIFKNDCGQIFKSVSEQYQHLDISEELLRNMIDVLKKMKNATDKFSNLNSVKK